MKVSCFHCLAINEIFIGTDHHNADAIYRCWNCKKVTHVSVKQNPIALQYDPQVGKEPE